MVQANPEGTHVRARSGRTPVPTLPQQVNSVDARLHLGSPSQG